MFSELLIKNMPHDEANQEFKKFLGSVLQLQKFKIVHFQLTSKHKAIFLRFKGQKEAFTNLQLEFKGRKITLEDHYRPSIQAINMVEMLNQEVLQARRRKLKMEQLAQINLSNVSKDADESDFFKEMSKHGCINDIRIFEKGQFKGKKRLKCRLVVIQYEDIDGAINAFFEDKVEILGVFSKVKFYLTPKKIEKYLKKKNLTHFLKLAKKEKMQNELMISHSTSNGFRQQQQNSLQQEYQHFRSHFNQPQNYDYFENNHSYNQGNNINYEERPLPHQPHLIHPEPRYHQEYQRTHWLRYQKLSSWETEKRRYIKLGNDKQIEDVFEGKNLENFRFNCGVYSTFMQGRDFVDRKGSYYG